MSASEASRPGADPAVRAFHDRGAEQIHAALRSISGTNNAEAALRAAFALITTVVEGSDDAVFVKDTEGRYLLINSSGAAMLGRTMDEVVGRIDTAFFSPECAAKIAARDAAILRSGEVWRYEDVAVRDGEVRTYRSTKGALFDDQNRALGIWGVSRDVTRERSVERERDALTAALLRRERLAALGHLAATVAHEVRNPLGAIFNTLCLLRRNIQDEGSVDKLLAVVEEEAQRIDAIVAELLDFGRPVAPKMTEVNVTTLVDEALTSSVGQRDASRIEIIRDIPDRLATIHGDPHLLRRALINLVANALDAVGSEGLVRVSARRDAESPDMMVLEFDDSGPGLTPEALEHLFEPFFTTKSFGTGLGLAVVKRIIDEHQGTLSVGASPEGGARFSVRVPLQQRHLE